MFGFLKRKENLSDVSETSVAETSGKFRRKNKIVTGLVALNCACLMAGSPVGVLSVAAAGEEATMSSITTDGITTITTVITMLWTMITGNPYLSFSITVSVVAAAIMLFKRVIGAARR